MAKSFDTLMETETILRWSEASEEATLWTASKAVRKQWVSFGFPVGEVGGGWGCVVPADRLTYRTLKK